MQVVKRDGRVMEFNKGRIIDAITKAMEQTAEGVDEELAKKIACSIEKQLENVKEISVYEIQDLVEKKLMVSSRKEVATAYITYRYTRDVARRSKTKNVFLDLLTAKSQSSDNKEDSYQSISRMMNSFAAEAIKPYVDMILLSKDVREAERRGYINIVNKSYYATKAIQSFSIPLVRCGEVLKECANIECAVTKFYFFLMQLQEEVIQCITIPPLEEVLAPFVTKTVEEEEQRLVEDLEMPWEQIQTQKVTQVALAEKRAKSRVQHCYQFLRDSFSTAHGRMKIQEGNLMDDNYGVVSTVELDLAKIASELCTHTKDTNRKQSLALETNEDVLIEEVRPFVEMAIKSLVERFRFQATATKNQFPLLMSGLWPESESLATNEMIENVLRKGDFVLKICHSKEAFQLLISEKNVNFESWNRKWESKIIGVLEAASNEYHLHFVLKNE